MLRLFLILTALTVSMTCIGQGSEAYRLMAKQYEIDNSVLQDFVDSYNFKCPEAISNQQLEDLIVNASYDHELKVMLESSEMDFRDVYVEARSHIPCATGEAVSRAY